MDTDVTVIGGGPAGLQATLSLGRIHRQVVMVDSGHYRNDPATHMHNVLGQDGRTPADLRARARAELATYPTVQVRDVAVDTVTPGGAGFRVALADGEVVDTRVVLLATGLRDVLPDVPGLEALWGTEVAHCPYCHGHEFSGRTVAILGDGPHVPGLAVMLSRMSCEAIVLTGTGRLEPSDRTQLDRLGVSVRDEPVLDVADAGKEGVSVRLEGGEQLRLAGLFVAPEAEQAAPFAAALGLDMLPSGCVEVDDHGRTSLPGVYAAGDLAHRRALEAPMASVVSAAAAGQLAAATIDQDLAAELLEDVSAGAAQPAPRSA